MRSTHAFTNRVAQAKAAAEHRTSNEQGVATLLSSMFMVMFVLLYIAFLIGPVLYTPKTRAAAMTTVDAWTQMYAQYGTNEIPRYSPAHSDAPFVFPNPGAVAPAAGVNLTDGNLITTRLAADLATDRYTGQVKEVICGRVEGGRIAPASVVTPEQRKGQLVACGAHIVTGRAAWPWLPTQGPFAFMSTLYGDYWYMGTPLPLRKAAR